MQKSLAAKQYKWDCACIAHAEFADGMPWPRAIVHMSFYWETDRKRDIDNAIAMMKNGIDGLVMGQIIVNDDASVLQFGGIGFDVDVTDPRVMVTVQFDDT